jgi:starch synthase
MKVLMVTSEMAPLAKTGGLADVLEALPKALVERGHEVAVAIPFYGRITKILQTNDLHLSLPMPQLVVDLPVARRGLAVWSTVIDGVTVYLFEDQPLFHRPQLYAENGREYPDNGLRFAYFCKAVLWAIKGLDWWPDVIHCHDWQAALVPIFLRYDDSFLGDDAYRRLRVLLTIHNLSFQGIYPAHTVPQIGLPPAAMNLDALEYWGNVNLLKGALLFSDWLTTVSPTYAREIQTPEFGCGLHGVIAARAGRLTGILNGIDADGWNPATDPLIPTHYDRRKLDGKAVCKRRLQERLGLTVRPDTPLMGIVSRLSDQKGFDLLIEVLPEFLTGDAQLALLGTGDDKYHAAFKKLAADHPGKVGLLLGFDNTLAHQIEAGADLFLMPSAFEPCGLNQMYSLRYGTPPVVRRTGGLADTIIDTSAAGLANRAAGGFVFDEYSPEALRDAIARALELYRRHPASWRRLMEIGMRQDNSWSRAAAKYEMLMENMISTPR